MAASGPSVTASASRARSPAPGRSPRAAMAAARASSHSSASSATRRSSRSAASDALAGVTRPSVSTRRPRAPAESARESRRSRAVATAWGSTAAHRASVSWASMPASLPSSSSPISGSTSCAAGERSASDHAAWGASQPLPATMPARASSMAAPGRRARAWTAAIAVGASVSSPAASRSSSPHGGGPPFPAEAAAASAASRPASGMTSSTDDARRMRSRVASMLPVRAAPPRGLALRSRSLRPVGRPGGREDAAPCGAVGRGPAGGRRRGVVRGGDERRGVVRSAAQTVSR